MPTVQDCASDQLTTDSDDASSLSSFEDASEGEISEEENELDIVKSVSCRPTCNALTWTGCHKRIPVLIFHADAIVNQSTELKQLGEKFRLSYKMVKTECKLVRSILTSHGFHEASASSSEFNLMWTGSHLKPYVLRTLLDYQKVNHFPRSYEVTRKDRLFKNIQRMQQLKGYRHFDFVPQSFIIPAEYQDFCAAAYKDRGPWIVKPAASSRGRGIFLITSPEQLPLEENVVVCRYIANPLLVDGFKFDLRLYVAVTSFDPLLIYLYEEGLTRFATVKFDKSFRTLRNHCMHLTNYSVNKKNTDYVSNDDADVEDYGNKWSLGAMLRYLGSQGIDTTALMMSIEDVIIKTLIAVELPIATACKMFMPFRGNCFELFGFDILIDENLRPWVLEVNLSPSLACDAPLDLKIKSNMVSDLFSLVGFVCQDPVKRKAPFDGSWNVRSRPILRPQSAKQRPKSSSLLYRRKRPESAVFGGRYRPQVSNSNTNNNSSSGNGSTLSMTCEEIRVLRRAKEEHARRGGWVRIFPSVNSWEMYSSFLQYTTTFNSLLHQNLILNRMKQEKVSASVQLRHRSIHLHSLPNSQMSTGIQSDIVLSQAVNRCKQYQRKLVCLGQKRVRRPRTASESKSKTQLTSEPAAKASVVVQGSAEDLVPSSVTPDSRDDVDSLDHVPQSYVAANGDTLACTATESCDVEQSTICHGSPTVDEETVTNATEARRAAPVKAKYDVIALLNDGKTLSKVQARFAFATYLTCIQQRLVAETRAVVDIDIDTANDQMDLVLRFLQRAANNLQQEFKVVVPSSRLPINSRRTILAAQLRDFVHIYNAETKQLKKRLQMTKADADEMSTEATGLEDDKFHNFVQNASEAELEEVLTVYTRISRSASIFLRANSKPSSTHGSTSPSKSAARDGGSDVEHHTSLAAESSGKFSSPEKQLADDNRNHRMSNTSNGAAATISSLPSNVAARMNSQVLSSYYGAVAAYSAKLGGPAVTGVITRQRPISASSHKSLPKGSASSSSIVPLSREARPISAYVRPPVTSAQSDIRSTVERPLPLEPDIDVNAALQRLASRQRRRQYSAIVSSNILSHAYVHEQLDDEHRESSVASSCHEHTTPPPATRPRSYSASRLRATSATIRHTDPPGEPFSKADTAATAVLQNNSNYYEYQKSMIEQSRALLEQSKAKHHALVAQAQSMQKRLRASSACLYSAASAEDSVIATSSAHALAPKPPAAPHGDRKTASHRTQKLARVMPLKSDEPGGGGDGELANCAQGFS